MLFGTFSWFFTFFMFHKAISAINESIKLQNLAIIFFLFIFFPQKQDGSY